MPQQSTTGDGRPSSLPFAAAGPTGWCGVLVKVGEWAVDVSIENLLAG